MAALLRRVFDYKLVFDSLCDSNGMVRLETLTARWPLTLNSDPESKVPHGCINLWTSCAAKDGYLDWNSFSTALQTALQEDAYRLTHASKPDMPRSKAEQRLASIRLKGVPGQSAPPPLGKVTAADIESFLSECDRDVLNKALKKLRKEVYKGQLSLHRAASNPRNKSADQPPIDTEVKTSRPVPGDKEGGITSREKDELTYGLEMMERTRKWYKERLRLLVNEDSQNSSHSKKVKAEELLKVLEQGTSTKSEMLSQLKEINKHLESLSSSAPSLTVEQQSRLTAQLSKRSESRQEKKPTHLPVGPPPAHVGKAVVEFSPHEQQHSPTIIVDTPDMPTFPVRKPETTTRQTKSLTKRAASTTEVHRVGVSTSSDKTMGYQQEQSRHTQPRYASSQNIRSTHTTQQDRDKPKTQRTPKRSKSFTSPTRTDQQHAEITSSVTDYPVHRPAQQYPLRGTTSMQELQPGYQAATTGRPPRQTGHLSKSSSVRNVSSGSHGNHLSTKDPSLIHQQVYSTGISYSTQTLPSRPSSRHHGHPHGQPQRHARNQVADHPPQRLGDNIQSIV